MKYLFLVVLPLAEIILFIWLTEYLGFWPVFTAVCCCSLAGVYVVRRVGLGNTKRLLRSLQMGQELSQARMHAALTLFSALALMFPGFISSFVGGLWLLPGLRARAIAHLTRHAMRYTKQGYIVVNPADYPAANDD